MIRLKTTALVLAPFACGLLAASNGEASVPPPARFHGRHCADVLEEAARYIPHIGSQRFGLK